MQSKKVILLIMDGWGKGMGDKTDAISCAETPFVDSLYKRYPHSELITYGEQVGLPAGQMGNSEVGHLNLGAGRVIYQDLVKIEIALREGQLANNNTFQSLLQHVKSTGCKLHIMGLLSDGGVHSSLQHLNHLLKSIQDEDLPAVYLHAFMDGRDTDPKSGKGFLQFAEELCSQHKVQLASMIGRYYAMDRDKRWERVKLAYDLLTKGNGKKINNWQDAIEESYAANITDEFILGHRHETHFAPIEEGDAVICFNFRTDRCREITQCLTQAEFPEFEMHPINNLHYVTMTRYDDNFKNVGVLFDKDNLQLPLGEVLSKAGKTQIRIAETEKYPHVTFFFNGGRENVFDGEKRILIPSPKVATYDLQPEMSAPKITEAILPEIEKGEVDFICLNFANTDMVGHTGVFTAAMKAASTVDNCVQQIVELALSKGYSIFLTADHGNADFMVNPDGSPNTAHSMNPVPLFFIDPNANDYELSSGKLADIAPTILHWMGLEVPTEMDGKNLITH